MNKRPFNNKSNYDPGRFRSTVTFHKQISTPDSSGGSDLSLVHVYTCKAIMLDVRDGNQLEINAGASILNDDKFFIMRYSKTFQPEKDMNLVCDDIWYVLRAIDYVDNIPHYVKLLCIKHEKPDTVVVPNVIYVGTSNQIITDPITLTPLAFTTEDIILPVTGKTNFAIAIPVQTSLVSVIDEDSEEDVTSEYLMTEVLVGDNLYKFYQMQVAIPYSASTTHIIKLSNG